jgi:hypothetical protein
MATDKTAYHCTSCAFSAASIAAQISPALEIYQRQFAFISG